MKDLLKRFFQGLLLILLTLTLIISSVWLLSSVFSSWSEKKYLLSIIYAFLTLLLIFISINAWIIYEEKTKLVSNNNSPEVNRLISGIRSFGAIGLLFILIGLTPFSISIIILFYLKIKINVIWLIIFAFFTILGFISSLKSRQLYKSLKQLQSFEISKESDIHTQSIY